MIEIVQAGPLSTVQDAGRAGYRHLGIPLAGALDPLALEVGNRLVGNPPGAAALEVTLGPTLLRFDTATRLALAGAEFEATLDGVPLPAWWSVPVIAGRQLRLAATRRGMRAYVCVGGGIEVVPVLGSRSTDLAGGFGGLAGRLLRDGDRLPLGPAPGGIFGPDASAFGVKSPVWCRFAHPDAPARRERNPDAAQALTRVRVIRGPQYEEFDRAARAALWDTPWRVTPRSNRMGYRLAGPALGRGENAAELLSHAVLPGAIQVPPGGQPIVLMNDAQTTGGYPQIGTVIQADFWKLAQVRLNGALRFVEVTPLQARQALAEVHAYLRQIEAAIGLQAAGAYPLDSPGSTPNRPAR